MLVLLSRREDSGQEEIFLQTEGDNPLAYFGEVKEVGMKMNHLKNLVFNLILDSEITEEERKIFLKAKANFAEEKDCGQLIWTLKIDLASLAISQRLSPKTLKFYYSLQKEFPARNIIGRLYGMF